VVVLAAGHPLSALSGGSARGAGQTLAGPLTALAAALLVAAVTLFAFLTRWMSVRHRDPEDAAQPARFHLSGWDRVALALLPLLLVGLVTLAVVEAGRSHRTPAPAIGVPRLAQPRRGALPTARDASPDRTGWVVAGAAAATVLLISSAVFTLRGRKGRSGPPAGDESAAQVQLALGHGLADLETERDPRRAVIMAYSTMESALSRVGHRRRSSEAPREYLSRVLRELQVSGASAARLTRLFELARFSRRAMGERAREEAIASLRLIRDELGALS
jgi:hypothetical protein